MAKLLHSLRMTLSPKTVHNLEYFFSQSKFSSRGAVITDLDGTAVHEFDGKTIIHKAVELGLKKVYDLGRPIVINTLRFPLSVIRGFALDWYRISNAAIPVVLLNGSQLGYIIKEKDKFSFEQLIAFPLSAEEITQAMELVKKLVGDSINDIILFYYPENWEKGEIIWTPDAQRIPHLQQKYTSASSVTCLSVEDLKNELLNSPVCMILLLVDLPSDKLMAYQHSSRNNFITHEGVDKSYGAAKIATLLNFDLKHSIGAGDSLMDNFLNQVGLSVHVGNPNLPFQGKTSTIKLGNFDEFGALLNNVAELRQTVLK